MKQKVFLPILSIAHLLREIDTLESFAELQSIALQYCHLNDISFFKNEQLKKKKHPGNHIHNSPPCHFAQ